MSDERLHRSSRVVFAEVDRRLIGAWRLRRWKHIPGQPYSPAIFDLVDAPEYAHLMGTPSPVHREQGDRRGPGDRNSGIHGLPVGARGAPFSARVSSGGQPLTGLINHLRRCHREGHRICLRLRRRPAPTSTPRSTPRSDVNATVIAVNPRKPGRPASTFGAAPRTRRRGRRPRQRVVLEGDVGKPAAAPTPETVVKQGPRPGATSGQGGVRVVGGTHHATQEGRRAATSAAGLLEAVEGSPMCGEVVLDSQRAPG